MTSGPAARSLKLQRIVAKRISLEPIGESTAKLMLEERYGDLNCGSGWPHEDTLDGIRMALRGHHPPGWFVMRDDLIIGDCGIHGFPSDDEEVEIGYGLAEPYRGLGYGSELVVAVTGWLLRQPGVRYVVANGVLATNGASRGALESAGFEVAHDSGRGVDYTVDSARFRRSP